MGGTLEIENNLFVLFPVAFSWVLHKLGNHTKNKENFRSIVGKINETIDQLLIECSVKVGILKCFTHIDSILKRIRIRITINLLKTCYKIHYIFRLRNKKNHQKIVILEDPKCNV
jgi:hypothetical protein